MRGLGTGELKHPRFTKEEAAASGEVVHERLRNSKPPYLQVAKAKRNGQREVIGKPAVRALHGNVNGDNFKNVANVEMLPIPMLPVPIEIEDWEWQHWMLATFDQVIGKNMTYPKR